jgi:hypothetical protein
MSFATIPILSTRGLSAELSMSTLSALGLLAAVVLSLVLSATLHKRKQRPLPPGPSRWPILGNVFDMPTEKEWLTFSEWEKTYGIDNCRA